MALPSSGAISMSQVNTELGSASTTTISLGQASVRTLFGVASGAISLNDGHGKSNTYTIEYLVIAGGGSGAGIYAGGGGGAGGYLASSAAFTPAASYTITVGAGGASSGEFGNGYNEIGRAHV